jgi:hypothetical protein
MLTRPSRNIAGNPIDKSIATTPWGSWHFLTENAKRVKGMLAPLKKDLRENVWAKVTHF